ncbi:MAG: S1 RNA-binding domain-containing protein [Pelolinea sp.]|nr:S1 RNA-binding domain-containing protein [Pelolinea sp.]
MDQNNGNQNMGESSDDNNITNMASLLAQEGLDLNLPQAGEIKTGTIASISPGQIMVGIGAKSEGIIRGEEFEQIPADVFASLEVGQEIPVFVITPEDHQGNLILSFVRALEAESWEKAQTMMKEKESFTGIIEGFNRGGLLVSFNELHGFIPSSQLSFSRRAELTGDTLDKRYGDLTGQEITLHIIEVDQERRRLIFSERSAVHESRDTIRDKVIEKLEVGDVRTGRITSLADFGAFVNINGADGLVHLSEISWDRIRHPGDELKIGEEVKVEVISIDEEKRHIGLSIRRLQDDPWQDQIKDLRVGQLVEATITRLTKFGAFARLTSDIEGLIHISELSDEHIGHPKEVLHEEDEVTLRIIKIEQDSHRIGLSLRRVESLAFADMDLKALEEELDDTDITLSTDEPSSDEPSSDEPSSDEPSSDEPSSDEPSSDEPSSDEPSSDEPSSDEPLSDEPPSDEPSEPSTEAAPTEDDFEEKLDSAETPDADVVEDEAEPTDLLEAEETPPVETPEGETEEEEKEE